MARPKVHHEDRVTTAFRLPKDLHAKLTEAAAERDLSANFLAVKALEEFLDNLVPADQLRLTRNAS
ncbi:MAG: ribbon-helix-helix domain-containing protein [Actinobacteria bacterium]|nr:ribbon-helix-helix domain-containing protein [Actinomycetota bacterium]